MHTFPAGIEAEGRIHRRSVHEYLETRTLSRQGQTQKAESTGEVCTNTGKHAHFPGRDRGKRNAAVIQEQEGAPQLERPSTGSCPHNRKAPENADT